VTEIYKALDPTQIFSDQTEVSDHPSYTCTDSICAYYEPLTNNFVDEEINLNGQVPHYVQGDLINACPSLYEVGKYQLQNFADGYVRYNRYRIDGHNLSFSSKLAVDTAQYIASMKHQEP
jgi:hypothetical protein